MTVVRVDARNPGERVRAAAAEANGGGLDEPTKENYDDPTKPPPLLKVREERHTREREQKERTKSKR
jgi:hypothetical protein